MLLRRKRRELQEEDQVATKRYASKRHSESLQERQERLQRLESLQVATKCQKKPSLKVRKLQEEDQVATKRHASKRHSESTTSEKELSG